MATTKKRAKSSDPVPEWETTRREFLKGATAVTAGALAGAPRARAEGAGATLPTVALGSHRVTRLIVGSNPIYGYSHFNRQYDQHMLEWFTDERIVKLLLDCEKAEINTWQASFNYNMKRQFPKIRGAGCKIQFICLAAGKLDFLKTYIDKVHDLGIAAGISTHNPKIVDTLREKGFANDFYMAGLHYLNRHPEEWMKEIGTLPLGDGFISSDPPKMAEAIRKVDKPALVYKVLAAGRKCESEDQKRKAIAWAYKNIKPIDATIIGLYPRYSDQVTETTKMVREILA
ncbi:MAG: twin-arginine translocation signal domain-containing protein [Acidobacteriia bacterium]|nr:twin-arginine translocation signal domain-containing protein [Terriglobia bacterium]